MCAKHKLWAKGVKTLKCFLSDVLPGVFYSFTSQLEPCCVWHLNGNKRLSSQLVWLFAGKVWPAICVSLYYYKHVVGSVVLKHNGPWLEVSHYLQKKLATSDWYKGHLLLDSQTRELAGFRSEVVHVCCHLPNGSLWLTGDKADWRVNVGDKWTGWNVTCMEFLKFLYVTKKFLGSYLVNKLSFEIIKYLKAILLHFFLIEGNKLTNFYGTLSLSISVWLFLDKSPMRLFLRGLSLFIYSRNWTDVFTVWESPNLLMHIFFII